MSPRVLAGDVPYRGQGRLERDRKRLIPPSAVTGDLERDDVDDLG
jgi:hypothetical protein